MTIAAEIAAFACSATAGTLPGILPGAVAERARLCVVDHLHAVLHGASSQTVALLTRYTGGVAHADGEAVALLLGASSTVCEIDDVHQDTSMHPGSVVVAAALGAASGGCGVDDRRLLAAVALGYEVAIRMSIAAGERHYHYFHATATCGTIAAAVAASRVYGLDETRTAHAIGLAATMASGLWEDINKAAIMVKHLHSGLAAERGVRAARLAALGMHAARQGIEGDKGFLAALARPDARYPHEAAPDRDGLHAILLDGLGERWAILRNIYKRYPFCLGCFEPLEGMDDVLKTTGRGVAEVADVRIELYTPTAHLVGNQDPVDELQAKFSASFAIALLLAGRDPETVPTPVEWLGDPAVRRWYPRIKCVASDVMRPRLAYVHVTWNDGTTSLGNRPLRSLEAAEVMERFAAIAQQRLGLPAARALEDRLSRLGREDDCADLLAMLREGLGRQADGSGEGRR